MLSEIGTFLINADWIKELAEALEGPLENVVNANLFPLPQDDADVSV